MKSQFSCIFDLSVLSGCYYAKPGTHFGVGRVAYNLANELARHFPEEIGFSSANYSAECPLYLRRELPHLQNYCIEQQTRHWEKAAIGWVDLADPSGGLRPDLYSKIRRNVWRRYNDHFRWRLNQSTRKKFHDAQLIHAEFGHRVVARCPSAKRVYTVHDLISIRDAPKNDSVALEQTRAFKAEFNAGAFFACDSEYTATDLIDLIGGGQDRIIPMSLGLDSVFRPVDAPEQLAAWRKKLSLADQQPYVIAHTGQLKRKNLIGVIETIHDVRSRCNPELMLVFAGYSKQLSDEFALNVPAHIPWQNFVRFTGPVSDDQFPILYSGASLMLFLSWAEGFGLPPLEAMGCGTPVVCSNRTSLPEVVGDAALVVDPADPDQASKAVIRILQDSSFAETLREKGFQRAAHFSWEAVGARVADIWKMALNS